MPRLRSRDRPLVRHGVARRGVFEPAAYRGGEQSRVRRRRPVERRLVRHRCLRCRRRHVGATPRLGVPRARRRHGWHQGHLRRWIRAELSGIPHLHRHDRCVRCGHGSVVHIVHKTFRAARRHGDADRGNIGRLRGGLQEPVRLAQRGHRRVRRRDGPMVFHPLEHGFLRTGSGPEYQRYRRSPPASVRLKLGGRLLHTQRDHRTSEPHAPERGRRRLDAGRTSMGSLSRGDQL